jgi:predicted ArsR family transcriptional regulator
MSDRTARVPVYDIPPKLLRACRLAPMSVKALQHEVGCSPMAARHWAEALHRGGLLTRLRGKTEHGKPGALYIVADEWSSAW